MARLGMKRRKAVRLEGTSLVNTSLMEGCSHPLVYKPAIDEVDLSAWAQGHRTEILTNLLKHGALLFRGFHIPDIAAFEEIARVICPQLLDYVERAAPRSEVGNQIFTSTAYPSDQWIPLHHEMSYSHNWPTKLFFYCQQPAEVDGFTPVADDRVVFNKIPQEVKNEFTSRKIMYVRNYGEGVDMPWREVFQTESREELEAYFQKTHTQWEWLDGNRLRTRMIRQITARHPQTGDEVWFNHAHMFHQSNMPKPVFDALSKEFAPDEFPRNVFFGDGSPMDAEVLGGIRDLYRENAVIFPWEKGDFMILDNFLTTHGRSPFKGKRSVLVAMGELYNNLA